MFHMRKLLIVIFLINWLCVPSFSSEKEWKDLSGEHFIVYFNGDEEFTKEVLKNAERYYTKIAAELGYPRYSGFWTWSNRIKIYIYPDQDAFIKATGEPASSRGMADYKKREINGYALGTDFIDSTLPHEIAHLTFRDFVGLKRQIPPWLDEGVAQWAEEKKRPEIKALAKQLYDENTLLSIEDITSKETFLSIKTIMNHYLIHVKDYWLFLRSNRNKMGEITLLLFTPKLFIDTYYLQAASFVGFLLEKYGSSKFADFCREIGDGKSADEAIRSTYHDTMQNLKEVERNWRDYIANQGRR